MSALTEWRTLPVLASITMDAYLASEILAVTIIVAETTNGSRRLQVGLIELKYIKIEGRMSGHFLHGDWLE